MGIRSINIVKKYNVVWTLNNRTYREDYQCLCDDTTTTTVDVATHPDCPKPGQGSPLDAQAICDHVEISPFAYNDDNIGTFNITAVWNTNALEGSDFSPRAYNRRIHPLSRPVIKGYQAIPRNKPMVTGNYLNFDILTGIPTPSGLYSPIITTMGEPPDPIPTYVSPYARVTFERNEQYMSEFYIRDWVGTVNDADLTYTDPVTSTSRTLGKWGVLCDDMAAVEIQEDWEGTLISYYRVVYSFLINPDTWNLIFQNVSWKHKPITGGTDLDPVFGGARRITNRDLQVLNSETITEDSDGEFPANPQFVYAAGPKLNSLIKRSDLLNFTQPAALAVCYRGYEYPRLKDFSDLGLFI